MPSHLVVQTREKHAVQQISNATFGSWIGAVEGKGSFLPTKADHGAPLLHHGIFFSDEHWNSPFTWRSDLAMGWRHLSIRVPSRRQVKQTTSLETFQL
jgi:hypothetical protein